MGIIFLVLVDSHGKHAKTKYFCYKQTQMLYLLQSVKMENWNAMQQNGYMTLLDEQRNNSGVCNKNNPPLSHLEALFLCSHYTLLC